MPKNKGPVKLEPDGTITLPPGTKVTVDDKEIEIPEGGGNLDLSTGEIKDAPPDTPDGPDKPGNTGGSGNSGGTNRPARPGKPTRGDDESTAPCPRDETCPIWPFTDAVPTAWYHDGVHYCVERKLMIGVTGELFKPDIPLTRAMVAQVLYNRAGHPQIAGEDPFTDVKYGAWYWPAVTWAAQESAVLGYSDGRFGPNDPVTREQLAAILWRNAGRPKSEYALAFSDSGKISGYAVPALRWTTEKQIVQGYTDGAVAPQDTATRAEAAQMFYRYFKGNFAK